MPELFGAQKPIIKTKFESTEGSEHVHGLVLHPKHMNDLALWKAFKSGDEKAFMTIFDRSTKPMYNYGCKVIGDGELVKDAIQELFIEVWQTRSRLRDTDSIKFYLFKCLRRKLIKLKTRSEKQHYGNLSVECNEDASPSYEFLLISEQIELEKKERVMSLLKTLTKRQHEAIFLRYFEDLNCEQIAAVMELSKQAVYNLLHHALDQLKRADDADTGRPSATNHKSVVR